MISFVKGTVADIGENCLVVENGGIGYEIYMTGRWMSERQPIVLKTRNLWFW